MQLSYFVLSKTTTTPPHHHHHHHHNNNNNKDGHFCHPSAMSSCFVCAVLSQKFTQFPSNQLYASHRCQLRQPLLPERLNKLNEMSKCTELYICAYKFIYLNKKSS